MIQDVQFQFQMSINSCYGTNASSISFTLVAPQSNDYPVGEVLSSQFNPCEICVAWYGCIIFYLIPGYSLRASSIPTPSSPKVFRVGSLLYIWDVFQFHRSPAWCIGTCSSSIVAILVCAVLSGVNSCYGLLL